MGRIVVSLIACISVMLSSALGQVPGRFDVSPIPIPEYIAKVQVVGVKYTDTGTGVYVSPVTVVTAAHNIRDLDSKSSLTVDGLVAEVVYKNDRQDFAILNVSASSKEGPFPKLSSDLSGTLTTCGYKGGVLYTEKVGNHKSGRWVTAEVAQGMSGGPVLNQVGDLVGTIIGGGRGRDTYITDISLIVDELRGRGLLD